MDIQDIMTYIKEAVELKHKIDAHETTSFEKVAIENIVSGLEDLALIVVRNSKN